MKNATCYEIFNRQKLWKWEQKPYYGKTWNVKFLCKTLFGIHFPWHVHSFWFAFLYKSISSVIYPLKGFLPYSDRKIITDILEKEEHQEKRNVDIAFAFFGENCESS